jgi:hypothetical protein
MARGASVPSAPQHAQLTPETMRLGIRRLGQCIEKVEAFDPVASNSKGDDLIAVASAMTAAVESALGQTFGNGTVEYRRYAGATDFSWPLNYMHPSPAHEMVASLQSCKTSSLALLRQAVSFLEGELELAPPATPSSTDDVSLDLSRKVFIVHGHDEGAREAVARFLTGIDFQPIILHEQASQNRTVIEKVERHGDVGFAVVLLTPDDIGGSRDGEQRPRTRQNVILELGYFVGRLGRERVCALKRGDLEIPSDFGGVVYETFDASAGWKLALGRELRAAGYDIDWNKVMQ